MMEYRGRQASGRCRRIGDVTRGVTEPSPRIVKREQVSANRLGPAFPRWPPDRELEKPRREVSLSTDFRRTIGRSAHASKAMSQEGVQTLLLSCVLHAILSCTDGSLDTER